MLATPRHRGLLGLFFGAPKHHGTLRSQQTHPAGLPITRHWFLAVWASFLVIEPLPELFAPVFRPVYPDSVLSAGLSVWGFEGRAGGRTLE